MYLYDFDGKNGEHTKIKESISSFILKFVKQLGLNE